MVGLAFDACPCAHRSKDVVERKCARAVSNEGLIISEGVLTEIHDMVPADGAVVDDDVPGP